MRVKQSFLRLMDGKYNYSARKAKVRLMPWIIGISAWLFVCGWFSSQSVKFNYEINELSQKRDSIKSRTRMLDLRIQSMMSGEQLAKAASERYGFKNPGEAQVVVIRKKRSFFN